MTEIVALGGGGFSVSGEVTKIDRFVLSRARRARPRVCFLPTASGDSESYVLRFYRAFAKVDCVPTDLTLFHGRPADLRAFLSGQDVIYVGGGNPGAMLVLWRRFGWDDALREAAAEGVVLAGVSAGAMCWFADGLNFEPANRSFAPLGLGLGMVAGSYMPHADRGSEFLRACEAAIAEGTLPDGYAVGDDAALHFVDGALVEMVLDRESAGATRLRRTADGVEVTPLAGRLLEATMGSH